MERSLPNAEATSPSKEPTALVRVLAGVWLAALTILSVTKISVGSLYVNSGCLGIPLLPYYLLIGGILALIPAFIALMVTGLKQSNELLGFWDMMARTFMITLVVMISGTIYILVCATRVVSLDRLCVDTWVPVFTFVTIALDWLMFIFFFRLFCVNSVPEPPSLPSNDDFFHEQSPFYMWKHRRARAFPSPRME